MMWRMAGLAVAVAMVAAGAPKKTVATGRGENEDVILNVTIYTDPAAVKQALGDDLGGHYIVAQVTVEPKYTKEITIDRDDFMLRTDKDGDRSKPMAPSQIAGAGALLVKGTKGPGGLGAERGTGWSLGGAIGLGGGGTGMGPGAAGGGVEATVEKGGQESPVKKVLEEKVLPEKKIDGPVTGFLYFPLEKQKMKDLELVYGGRENRIRIRFK